MGKLKPFELAEFTQSEFDVIASKSIQSAFTEMRRMARWANLTESRVRAGRIAHGTRYYAEKAQRWLKTDIEFFESYRLESLLSGREFSHFAIESARTRYLAEARPALEVVARLLQRPKVK